MAIALLFGFASMQHKIGEFSKAGPGLFPLLVSCLLFLIGLSTTVRARFIKPVPLDYSVKNISIILLGLCGFAVLSEHLNMIAAIFFLVFVVSYAGASYSIVRNLKITAGLIVVAFMFRNLLGLQLPLF